METGINSEKSGERSTILLLGDWLALALFVFLGQIDHEVLQAPRLLGQTALLGAMWSVVALATGVHRVPREAGLRHFLARSLLAWLAAAPLALLARALLQGQATIIVAFMMVTM